MSIKILGGFARGQVLAVPKGDITRPTVVMLRRRIFDYYQNLEGVTFVDLCGGTGAMGFEAWSRGASSIYLNEINRHVYKVLEENKENLLLKNSHKKNGELFCSLSSAEKILHQFKLRYLSFSEEQKENTIIFLDPPYAETKIYFDIFEIFLQEPWYFGQLWIESESEKGISMEEIKSRGIAIHKVFEQSDSYISITNFPQT